MKCLKCPEDAQDGFLYCGKWHCNSDPGTPDQTFSSENYVNLELSGRYVSLWNDLNNEIDLSKLEQELSAFRIALKKVADSPEHDVAVSFIANAEIAARNADGPSVLLHLSNIGQSEIAVAYNINATLITKAIDAL